tara:strand:- start:581 stop:1036 length:456 start_codon:yes stop_codon:yes gene_type:complete
MSYEQEIDINEIKYRDEIDKSQLMTPRQFERRIKLKDDDPSKIQLLSDIDEYYAFYITYLKNDKRLYVRLGLKPFKLGCITDIAEQMISNGHFEYEGGFRDFTYKSKPIKALPQKYVNDSEAKWNKNKNRFLIFGHYTGTMAYNVIEKKDY